MAFGSWSIFLHMNWQQRNRNLSTEISLPLPKPRSFLIPESPKVADPSLYILHFPLLTDPLSVSNALFPDSSEPAPAQQDQQLRLSSPGLTHVAAPLVSLTEAHLCVVIELSLCLLFDKTNWLSLCVLSNLKDHHQQLPVLDKVSQLSALIPGLVVVCFTAPGPDCQNPQSSCSKTELVFCFVFSFSP